MEPGFADSKLAVERESERRGRCAIGYQQGKIGVSGRANFIDAHHAAIADSKTDTRTAIDNVAGREPGPGFIDGEGCADAILRIADLDQHPLIERI